VTDPQRVPGPPDVTAPHGAATVTGMLEALRGLVPLTAAGCAERFAVQGRTPVGRSRDGVPTGWGKDGVRAWIQPFADGGADVSFAPWIRDVDASGYFDDLDAVYQEGERMFAALLPAIERSPLAGGLTPTGRRATGEDEYIALRKWELDGRGPVAGLVQHDGDLPVMLLVTLEQPA
jgi:hypothetical protein